MRVKIILCLIAAGYVFKKSNDAQMAIYAFIAALVLCFAATSYEAILEKDEEEKIFEKSDIQNRQYGRA